MSPEEVCSAIRYSGTEKPLWWLQSELVYVLERLIDAASQKAGSELGAFTPDEARSAWLSCGGDMEEAVNLCIIQRRNKVSYTWGRTLFTHIAEKSPQECFTFTHKYSAITNFVDTVLV